MTIFNTYLPLVPLVFKIFFFVPLFPDVRVFKDVSKFQLFRAALQRVHVPTRGKQKKDESTLRKKFNLNENGEQF